MSAIEREQSIDVLRGWAVWWMIAAHVVFFRFGLTSGIMNHFIHFGAIFCYVTFLFTFGVGIYHSLVVSTWNRARKIKMIRRILQLLFLYYLAATLSAWSNLPLNQLNPTFLISSATQVVTFAQYPGFTEYLPSFAIFTLFFYALRQLFGLRLRQVFETRAFFVLLGACVINLVANAIAHSQTVYQHTHRLFIGTPTSFDFPVLQYLVVVVLGVWVATWLGQEKNHAEAKILKLGYGILLATLALKYSFNFTHTWGTIVPWINTVVRWPPSPAFVLTGLSYTFLVWILTRWMLSQAWLSSLTRVMHYIGTHSMGLLLYHLIVLFVMKIYGVAFFNLWQTAVFFVFIFVSYFGIENTPILYRTRAFHP